MISPHQLSVTSIALQITSITNNLTIDNMESHLLALFNLTEKFGNETFILALHILLKDITSLSPQLAKQKLKETFISLIIKNLFTKEYNVFGVCISRAFKGINSFPGFIESLFKKVLLKCDQRVAIALLLSRTGSVELRSQCKKYLNDKERENEIIQEIKNGNFSTRILQELLYRIQKTNYFDETSREEIMSMIGEIVYASKNLDKSLRLFVFKQRVFNYKRKTNRLISFSNQNKTETSKTRSRAYLLAHDLIENEPDFKKTLISSLKKHKMTNEKDLAEVVCAFLKTEDKKDENRTKNLNLKLNLKNKLKVNVKVKKTKTEVKAGRKFIHEFFSAFTNTKTDWRLVLENLDCNYFDTKTKSSREALISILSFLGKNYFRKLLDMLCNRRWKFKRAKFRFLEIVMEFPTHFHFKGKRKPSEVKGKDNTEKSFSLKEIVELLISFDTGPERVFAERKILKLVKKDISSVFSVTCKLKTKNSFVIVLESKIIEFALKKSIEGNESFLTRLVSENLKTAAEIIKTGFKRKPFIITHIFSSFLQSIMEKTKNSTKTVFEKEMQKIGFNSLTLALSMEFEETEKMKNIGNWLAKTEKTEGEQRVLKKLKKLLYRNLYCLNKNERKSVLEKKGEKQRWKIYSMETIREVLNYTKQRSGTERLFKLFESKNKEAKEGENAREILKKLYYDLNSVEKTVEQLLSENEENTLKNVFEVFINETSFWGEYSDKQIQSAADFFETMINKDKINALQRIKMEKSIIKILKFSAENSKEFYFATKILKIFVENLENFPYFCREILESRSLRVKLPDTFATIKRGLKDSSLFPKPWQRIGSISIQTNEMIRGGGIKIGKDNKSKGEDDIKQSEMSEEKTKVSEDITLLLSNLSESNYIRSAEFFEKKLLRSHKEQFARDFVLKLEENFQIFYRDFYRLISSISVKRLVTKFSYEKTMELLQHKNIIKSPTNQKLKNMAHWLGAMLLSQGKPVLSKYIDLREILYSAYFSENREKLLFAVVVFATTLLSHARDNDIFQVPNPWTVGILSLLCEIEKKGADVDSKIKSEIKSLTENLGIVLEDIPVKFSLDIEEFKRRVVGVPPSDGRLDNVGNDIEDQVIKKLKIEMSQLRKEMSEDPVKVYDRFTSLEISSAESFEKGIGNRVVAYLERYVSFNPKCFPIFSTEIEKKTLKSQIADVLMKFFIPLAVRCMVISAKTTQSLLSKDFGFEPNDAVYIKAAFSTARGLLSGLVATNVRENLRVEMVNTVSNVVNKFHKNKNGTKSAVNVVASENFAVCLHIICSLGDEGVGQLICEEIQQKVAMRRKCKEKGLYFPGESLSEQFIMKNGDSNAFLFPNSLPSDLQPKRNGLSGKQRALYENYMFFANSQADLLGRWAMKADFVRLAKDEKASGGEITKIPFEDLENVDPENSAEFFQHLDFMDLVIENFEKQKKVPKKIKNMEEENLVEKSLESFEIIKIFKDSPLLEKYEATARIVKSFPKFRSLLVDLPANQSPCLEISEFVKQLSEYCLLAKKGNEKLFLFLFCDHVYSEMFDLSFNLVFLDFCALVLSTVKTKAEGMSHTIKTRLSRFYISEPDNKKYTLEVFKRLIENKLLKTKIIDVYFASLIMTDKPNLNVRCIYFIAAFLGSIDNSTTRISDVYTQITKSLYDISTGKYDTSRIEKSALEFIRYFSKKIACLSKKPTDSPQKMAITKQSLKKEPEQKTEPENDRLFSAKLALAEWRKARKDPSEIEKFFKTSAFAGKLGEISFLRVFVAVAFKIGEVENLADLFHGNVLHGPCDSAEAKVSALQNQFQAIAEHILRKHSHVSFNPVPAHRLLQKLLRVFLLENSDRREFHTQVLVLFIECFARLQPAVAPGFALSWLVLISEGEFVRQTLTLKNEYASKCRFHLMRLFCVAFSFLGNLYQSETSLRALYCYYSGLLRVVVAMSNDFDFFFFEFYYDFVTSIPLPFGQLRNIVLSCAPRTESSCRGYSCSSVDSLMGKAPAVNERWKTVLDCHGGNLRRELDLMLSCIYPSGHRKEPKKLPSDYFTNLEKMLRREWPADLNENEDKLENKKVQGKEVNSEKEAVKKDDENGSEKCNGNNSEDENKKRKSAAEMLLQEGRGKYDRVAVSAAVAYVGMTSFEAIREGKEKNKTVGVARFLRPSLLFFSKLLESLSFEGVYLAVNAMMDHVRCPSPHTHLFSLVVLSVYGRTSNSTVREIVMRVLLERLGGQGPHPEGLESLFRELVNNPFYGVDLEELVREAGESVAFLVGDICGRVNSVRNMRSG